MKAALEIFGIWLLILLMLFIGTNIVLIDQLMKAVLYFIIWKFEAPLP